MLETWREPCPTKTEISTKGGQLYPSHCDERFEGTVISRTVGKQIVAVNVFLSEMSRMVGTEENEPRHVPLNMHPVGAFVE